MIQVFSQDHERLGLLKEYKSLSVKKKLADGDKTLSFQYPRNAEGSTLLQPECYIRTIEDEFVLKEISGGTKWRKYTAVLNLEELEGKSFIQFVSTEKTIRECLTEAFEGTGWTVGECAVTKRRTIKKDNVCTCMDIIDQCISTYKCEVVYHTISKVIDIYEQLGAYKGVYFMEAVNLRKPPEFEIKSTGIYTQLRPVGKDGLTINVDGKDYIENHSFSNKNIMLTWKDERYTRTDSLLEDAILKLQELCQPTATYKADVIDLAKASEEYKDILQYSLGDTVVLVSKTDRIREMMRIAVITEYPEEAQKNTCELSTAKKTFADVQQEVVDEAVQEATATAAANTSQAVKDESETTTEEIGLEIKGLKTEILKDVSDSYLKKTDASGIATEAAASAAESATADAKKYTDDKLESYMTNTEATREIEAAKKAVLQDVSGTYATKQNVKDEGTKTVQSVEQLTTEMTTAVENRVKGVEDKLVEAEASKNDMVDIDGTVYRLGVQGGLMFIEEIESEG